MKEKNKTNPFGTVLNPTEEILWSSWKRGGLSDFLFPGRSQWFLVMTGVFVVFVVVIMFVTLKNVPFLETIGLTLLVLLFVGFRIFGGRILGNIMSGNFVPKMPGITAYAVTSERLLILKDERTHSLLLEKVPLMSALTSNGTRGTLSFGAVFPMWGGLDNVPEVKRIIEQAKKERIKELNA